MRLAASFLSFALVIPLILADGPKDNIPDNVRPVPPVGNTIPDATKLELQSGLNELQKLISEIGSHDLLPDVQVYEKAVRWALQYDEIYDPKNAKNPAANVKAVLKNGLERAKALKDGKAPWATATGLVVRGYKSKIDGSVQPYGLVIPPNYDFKSSTKHRLDFWWHGRGETLSEANFIADRERNPGQFTPDGAIVVHPYGRYCNANKFAGEIDSLEILDHLKKHYRIDESRIVARGFSMGGAACWQYAVHYPTLFCAAAPGAGFAETREFLNDFQNEVVKPTWYEKKLWRMYDATEYAQNIFNIPTVAYSGEIDKQKQAADVMAREMKKVGLELTHIIGPKTGHSYEKNAKQEVIKQVDAIVAKGKVEFPKEINFTTYTLRYNECAWLRIDGLEKHWEPATVVGKYQDGKFILTTRNVSELRIRSPFNKASLYVDGTYVCAYMSPSSEETSRKFPTSLHAVKNKKGWETETEFGDGPRKIPGLQGPIDDAFMDSFLMVKPTGTPFNPTLGEWTKKEMKHAVDHWRKQFRGDARIKNDKEINDDDIKNHNLILWGDPQSNAILAKIAGKLPVSWESKMVIEGDKKWTAVRMQLGDKNYDGNSHVPVMIFPNPLNPKKYVVLNSGFTFREYAYLNNARQVPMLPDYAIVDTTTPPNSRWPGKVVRAGFFGERWELLPNDGQ